MESGELENGESESGESESGESESGETHQRDREVESCDNLNGLCSLPFRPADRSRLEFRPEVIDPGGDVMPHALDLFPPYR